MRTAPCFSIALLLLASAGCQSRVYPGDSPASLVVVEGQDFVSAFPSETRAGVERAIGMWNSATKTQFRYESAVSPVTIPIHFAAMPASCGADAEGCYDPSSGEVWVVPVVDGDGGGLAQTLAHELGHAIGLAHVPVGVMSTSGGRFDALQPDDLAEYGKLY